ncbi:MAG: histone deacetylase superfamily protein [uncultured bacterium]|nr:MAG: histone deacetylase superfamily protein [uncultured bacterium]
MRIIYSRIHLFHIPEFEIFNGHAGPHSEVPARVENIKKGLIEFGFTINKPIKKVPLSLINRVHEKNYVQFLKKLIEYSYPSVFPYNELNKNKKLINPLANFGKYSFDLYTPMSKNIFKIAVDSASLAFELADDIKNKKIKVGYALCRPPGHHAERSKMGGYCYLNNSAIAAEHLSTNGKVAILDVDFHHGNGTQNIFYDRGDVLTISIHADPNWKFPYFTGFSNERGINEGQGKNFNFFLPKGTTNNQYQRTLEKAINKIEEFKPKYLVIPLGLDTHQSDPIGGFELTTKYYTEMAKTINSLKLPTLIVQEGGYNTKLLGNNVVAFLNGFI